eukprot:TRINITY_DN4434_c0_g2_i1.p1 TRINITY_DN4434_c0_g2~~TRINITY_DN4434_c0_g2_i1.p1  ORF type:complete len:725 (-),score=91.10 TRINITY_DN4434_c0_g2_i1:95-2080(-)
MLDSVLGFTPCKTSSVCTDMILAKSREYHSYAAAGLVALLMREAASLAWSFWESQRRFFSAWDAREMCLPSFLVCLVLLSLLTAEILFATTPEPFSHAMPPVDGLTEPWRPVLTLRVVEWLVSVPALLTLAGHCALRRPMREVIGPILITDTYVAISWLAMVSHWSVMKWGLVLLTFVGYAIASRSMLKWITAFSSETSEHSPDAHIRRYSAAGLIGLFGVYGVIYLLALTGCIDVFVEQFCFTVASFGTKVMMSISFSSLRATEHRQQLIGTARCLQNVNTQFMSLLKGSFDLTVPCLADRDGSCIIGIEQTADVHLLQQHLNRPVAGFPLESLVPGNEQKEIFRQHIRNVVRQSEEEARFHEKALLCKSDEISSMFGAVAPVSQSLHCLMERLLSDDHHGTELVAVVLHMSALPTFGEANHCEPRSILIAIVLDSMSLESTAPSVCIPTTDAFERKTAPAAVGEHTVRYRAREDDATGSNALGLIQFRDSAVCEGEELEEWNGNWDVGSQSSKVSFPGSVHMACRQVLGPLLDTPAPARFVASRMADYVDCASQMVQIGTTSKVANMHYQQQLNEWNDLQERRIVSSVLKHSGAPGVNVEESVWRSEILPLMSVTAPIGPKPEPPRLTDNDTELWAEAWTATFDRYSSSGESDENDSAV